MPYREKVLKGLECCTSGDGCVSCPYSDLQDGSYCKVRIDLDALALLKEQEEQIRKLAEENDDLKKARNEVYYSGYDGSFIL